MLKMGTCIFMCLSTKLASLHHVNESWLEFKCGISCVDRRSSMNVIGIWCREFTESLLRHGFKTSIELPPDWFVFFWEIDASLLFLLFLIVIMELQ